MTYDPLGGGALDYFPCRYGTSKLMFRGPKRQAEGDHIAVIGGTETYGRFIETPYPELLEQLAGRSVLNLGCVNAGIDVFNNDRAVLDLCEAAKCTVIEVTGAHNMSNRFYSVHPRRNDRFLRASSLLKTIYREVDFTEFNFTRHMLAGLRDASAEKFQMISEELKSAWMARMSGLITRIGGPVVLLWMADHRPDRICSDPLSRGGPLFVDAAMMETLRDQVAAVVEVVADVEEVQQGYDRMKFSEMDAQSAGEMLGPVVHKRVAYRLIEAIRAI